MMEVPVRRMFLKMIEWYVGIKTGFAVAFGKAGKNMKKYISPQLYDKILFTYPGSNIENIWGSLFEMTNLFDELASEIAGFLEFHYEKDEACSVKAYLREAYTNSKQRSLP